VEVGDFRYDEIYAHNSHYKKENIMSRNIVRTSVLSLILLLSFTLLLSETLAEPPSNFHESDAGTEANPYLIANLANLRWLSETPEVWGTGYESFSFLQTADIDATETAIWDFLGQSIGGQMVYRGFSGIGSGDVPFMGVYNGSNFAIVGLHSYRTNLVFPGGFFHSIQGALVKNTHLIEATLYRCFFIDNATDSIILNCHISGVNNGCYATGLIRIATDSHIEFCSSKAHIVINCYHATSHRLSGLVRVLRNSVLKNSFFYGSLTQNASGGLAGLVSYSIGSVIENCYATATVSVHSYNAGVIFALFYSPTQPQLPSIITQNFWDTTMTGALIAGGGLTEHNFGLPTAQLQMASTFIDAGWDFENVWAIDPGINGGYPYHRSNTRLSPITSCAEMTTPVAQSMRSVIYPNPVRTGDVTFRANVVKPQMEISIYNVKGQLVKKSTDFAMGNAESRFVWGRKNDKGQSVAPGVYLYQINAGDDVSVGKLLIIK
jgi:hypothetical protein